MPQQPKISGDVELDSWSLQVTQELNALNAPTETPAPPAPASDIVTNNWQPRLGGGASTQTVNRATYVRQGREVRVTASITLDTVNTVGNANERLIVTRASLPFEPQVLANTEVLGVAYQTGFAQRIDFCLLNLQAGDIEFWGSTNTGTDPLVRNDAVAGGTLVFDLTYYTEEV